MADDFQGFGPDFRAFLADVGQHNDKAWFAENKKRFQANVQDPSLAFVRAMAPRLAKLSPHLAASDKKAGGSMMRFYRDTRFGKDKRPYNEHVSFQFAHAAGKGSAAPGFFLRITADTVTAGTGIWQPETALTNTIREHIVANAAAWKRARGGRKFTARYGDLQGESLKRPPRGFDPEHPLVEDLKRKDFVAFCELDPKLVTSPKFPDEVAAAYKDSRPLCAFLADAVGVPF